VRREEVFKILKDRPIFTITQLAIIEGKSPEYVGQLVYRWAAKNEITRIERGKFTIQTDPLLLSSRITWPSYISIWSSLSYHKLIEQIPHSIWVVTTRSRKNMTLNVRDTQIFFIKTDPTQLFGYEKIVKDGVEIFMADVEKTIIDCLLFKKVSISELREIFQTGAKKINKQRLVEYSIRTKRVALMKRIGYLMDINGYDFYHKLKTHIYDQITILEPNLPNRGTIDRKWKIEDNVGI
jgi:predicted transcriptional regulator of viral defense system